MTASRRISGFFPGFLGLGLVLDLVLVAGLALPALGCQTQETGLEQQIVSDVQHGRYELALTNARRLAEQNPGDERLQALYRDAQVAMLLDRARGEIFHGDPTRGLELLEEAWEIVPGHPTVANWIGKTRAQLATHWLDVAAENTGSEGLGAAREAYEKVLEYEPENIDARRGLGQLLLLENYRAGMSKTYFDDGLSNFREFLLEQAKREFTVSRRYAENEPAIARGEQVEVLMAEERLAQARTLEEDGLYFAARNEYRLVLLIEPHNIEGRAGLDRMDREVRATRSLAEADMEIRRGQLDKAKESLAEADTLTEAQVDHVSLLRSGIEEKRLDDLYASARSLTEDYRYPEAVAAYDELLALEPDYRDARSRKSTLEEFISMAEEFYALATETSDDAVAEEYLRRIHPVIWPEYRDVVERLKAIDARRAAAQPVEDELPEASDEPMPEGEESEPESEPEPENEPENEPGSDAPSAEEDVEEDPEEEPKR